MEYGMIEEGNGEIQKRLEKNRCPRCETQWSDILVTQDKVLYNCFNCGLKMEERKDNGSDTK